MLQFLLFTISLSDSVLLKINTLCYNVWHSIPKKKMYTSCPPNESIKI